MSTYCVHMPRTVGKGPGGNGGGIGALAMNVKKTAIKSASPVEKTRTNWRAKNKRDPREIEMAKLFGPGFSMF